MPASGHSWLRSAGSEAVVLSRSVRTAEGSSFQKLSKQASRVPPTPDIGTQVECHRLSLSLDWSCHDSDRWRSVLLVGPDSSQYGRNAHNGEISKSPKIPIRFISPGSFSVLRQRMEETEI